MNLITQLHLLDIYIAHVNRITGIITDCPQSIVKFIVVVAVFEVVGSGGGTSFEDGQKTPSTRDKPVTCASSLSLGIYGRDMIFKLLRLTATRRNWLTSARATQNQNHPAFAEKLMRSKLNDDCQQTPMGKQKAFVHHRLPPQKCKTNNYIFGAQLSRSVPSGRK